MTMLINDAIVSSYSPKELYENINKYNIDELTLNWRPTKNNINHLFNDPEKLTKWLVEFVNIHEKNSKFSLTFVNVIEGMKKKAEKEIKAANTYQESIYNYYMRHAFPSLQITPKGEVFSVQEAFGDLALNNTIDYQPLFNIYETWDNNLAIKRLNKTFYKQVNQKECLQCKYKDICINTGFPVYNQIIKKHSSQKVGLDCYNPIYKIYESIDVN